MKMDGVELMRAWARRPGPAAVIRVDHWIGWSNKGGCGWERGNTDFFVVPGQ